MLSEVQNKEENMEFTKEKNYRKIISFLSVVCLIFAASTAYFAADTMRYKGREKLMNEKAVSSLCESLDSISVSLNKGVCTGDKQALEKIGNELCRQASAAKENLNLLDFENEVRDGLYRFLSQVGNFTVAIARDEAGINTENAKKLEALCLYAQKLSEGLNEICLDYYNGGVSLEKASGNLQADEDLLPDDFYDRVYDTAQTMTDYPTLVYDGPFADEQGTKKSEFLESQNEITAKEAQQKAAEFLGVQYGSLRREQDVISKIELYCFSLEENDITVTKRGGHICTFLSNTFALQENISAEEAIKRGLKYLEKMGYGNMKSSYYSIYDGVCTINFAFAENATVCYSDLIKVSIGLDTGKLVGFDARNYLISHRERSIPTPKITEHQAKNMISPALEVIDMGLAIIPLETQSEAFCYEIHCRDKSGKEVLVYLNALTGKQEDLLLLLYSDGGILTK